MLIFIFSNEVDSLCMVCVITVILIQRLGRLQKGMLTVTRHSAVVYIQSKERKTPELIPVATVSHMFYRSVEAGVESFIAAHIHRLEDVEMSRGGELRHCSHTPLWRCRTEYHRWADLCRACKCSCNQRRVAKSNKLAGIPKPAMWPPLVGLCTEGIQWRTSCLPWRSAIEGGQGKHRRDQMCHWKWKACWRGRECLRSRTWLQGGRLLILQHRLRRSRGLARWPGVWFETVLLPESKMNVRRHLTYAVSYCYGFEG